MRTFNRKVAAIMTGIIASLVGMNRPFYGGNRNRELNRVRHVPGLRGSSASATARTFSTEYPLILPAW